MIMQAAWATAQDLIVWHATEKTARTASARLLGQIAKDAVEESAKLAVARGSLPATDARNQCANLANARERESVEQVQA